MMPARSTLALILLTSMVGAAPAQEPLYDPPALHKPARPPTPEEIAHREARVLYGMGVLRQQRDRLLEATKLFEQARALDPRAAPIYRSLVPLYGALGRPQEALDACRKVLELAPTDHEAWYVCSRLHKGQGQLAEARTALQKAIACPSLAEHVGLYVQAHSDLGGFHEELREYDQAATALAVVLRILENPDKLRELDTPTEAAQEQAANTHERIIRLWIQAAKYDRAIAAFTQAVRTYPVLAVRLNLQLAQVHAAQQQFPDALARLDEYLRTRPVSTEGYELLATVLEKLGRGAEVLPLLEAYAGRDPHNQALELLLGRHYVRAGRLDQAEKYYQTLLDKHEASPEVYRGLLTLYREQKKMEKGFHALNLALARAAKQDAAPGDARAAARGRAMLAVLREDLELGKAMVPVAVEQLTRGRFLHHDAAFFLGATAARAKQLVEAEQLYRHCLEHTLDPQMELAVCDGLLRVLWELRKYDGVVGVCERGLKQAAGTNRLLFHLNHARALVSLGKVSDGLAEADRAVNVALDDDTRFVARTTRVRLFWFAERFDAALAECQALLKERLQPGQVRDVRHLLSGIYSAQKEQAKAEEQLQQILKDDANDATACNDLGYLWADQKRNLDEAERLIRKALDLDREQKKAAGGAAGPDNAAYLDSLGWVLFRRGDLPGARQWLEKSATLAGGAEDPVVWDHLGDVYSQMGDATRAAAAWRKALDLIERDPRRKADDRGPEIRRKIQVRD